MKATWDKLQPLASQWHNEVHDAEGTDADTVLRIEADIERVLDAAGYDCEHISLADDPQHDVDIEGRDRNDLGRRCSFLF